MAARNRTWTPDIVRQRIRVAQIVNRLQAHVKGLNKMTPTQVRAAEILLRKAIPDLQSVELSGEVTSTNVTEISREELIRIATAGIAEGSGEGVIEAAEGGIEPTGLH